MATKAKRKFKKIGNKSKKNKVTDIAVVFVLDETGSMSSCLDATISGFNEYLQDLLKQEKKKSINYRFTLTKFNTDKTEVVHNSISLKDVTKLDRNNYAPSALTPLYDAIGKAISSMNKEKNVLCVIMTDGEENSSKEYTRDKIFQLIKDKEKDGWTFAYLGANQDSWAIGQTLGFKKGNVINYFSDAKGTKKAFRKMSDATVAYSCAVADKGYGAAIRQKTSFFAGDEEVK